MLEDGEVKEQHDAANDNTLLVMMSLPALASLTSEMRTCDLEGLAGADDVGVSALA